jgi:hypothetical protein
MQRMSVLFWVSNCQIFKIKIKKMQSEIQKQKQKQKLLHTCIFLGVHLSTLHPCIYLFRVWMDGWKDGRMDGWKDGRMDGRMDGWMDGKILPTCKSGRDLGPWVKSDLM